MNLAGGLVFAGTRGGAFNPAYPTMTSVSTDRTETSILRNVRFTSLGHQAGPAPLAIVGADSMDILLEQIFIGSTCAHGAEFWSSNVEVAGLTVGGAWAGVVAFGGSSVNIDRHIQIKARNGFVTDDTSTINIAATWTTEFNLQRSTSFALTIEAMGTVSGLSADNRSSGSL